MLNTGLLERAFVVGVDPGFTGKFEMAQVHEIGGYWQWTLNPHFDIRLAGNLGFWVKDSKTWRRWPTVTCNRRASSPVTAKARLRGEKSASGRASRDLLPSSRREPGCPGSLPPLEHRSSNRSESQDGQTPSPLMGEGRGGGEARRGFGGLCRPPPPHPNLPPTRGEGAILDQFHW